MKPKSKKPMKHGESCQVTATFGGCGCRCKPKSHCPAEVGVRAFGWLHKTMGILLPLAWHRKNISGRMTDAKVVPVRIVLEKKR